MLMGIVSIYYLLFLMLSIFIYWWMPDKIRWIILLICSLWFYFTNAAPFTFLWVLFNVVTVYLAAMYIARYHKGRKIVFIMTLVINICMLIFMKYSTLITNTWNHFSAYQLRPVVVVSSLAVSFYLLQLLSYLIDVYRSVANGSQPLVERNPLKLLLFTIFFPLMTSGPISRFEQLGVNIFQNKEFCYKQVTDGLKRIAWGLIKKRGLADRLAIPVQVVFDNYTVYNGFFIWIATFSYGIQLYMDFSGCMDIAIGTAQCFGIQVQENFKAPYLARSIKDFWRRWHISLSSWLRDYIYIPLGGSKKGTLSKWRNILITFIISGIWHGGSYKFIFWGVVHALYQITGDIKDKLLGRLIQRKNYDNKITKGIQTGVTCFLVMAGWLIFRASSLKDSIKMMGQALYIGHGKERLENFLVQTGIREQATVYVFVVLGIILVLFLDYIANKKIDIRSYFDKCPVGLRMAVYWCVCILIICILWDSTEMPQFIYNQF